jgi:hypothetical protein
MKTSALVIRKDGPALRFDFDNTGELTVSEWSLVLEMAKLKLMGYEPNVTPGNLKIPGMLDTRTLTRTPQR